MSEIKRPPRRKFISRPKLSAKFQLSKDANIDYKNLSLIQKYINDRGKLVPRRISGVTAKGQRRIAIAIKYARYLGLLTTGGVKK
ncbi:MAG: 30S ribosomal protein S18 [Candidatus Omnitrophica bacterium]|nr:30S ribosomal protein S18 [Candidatus Omnitrophota bacterium]